MTDPTRVAIQRWQSWAAAALAVALLLPAAVARAQLQPRVETFGRPLLVRPLAPEAPISQKPAAPLAPAQNQRLSQARAWRDAGLLDRAREGLASLNAEVPHHALIVTELGRTLLARPDFAGVERLGRAERLALRDSVLLAPELALALERMGRAREAAQIVVEAWTASPLHVEWANATLDRLVKADPRGVRDCVEMASRRQPRRIDFARALARLAWKTGQAETALRALVTGETPGSHELPLRWTFAEDLLGNGAPRDSSGAVDALLDLAADPRFDRSYRTGAAVRAWLVVAERGDEATVAPRVRKALKDVPVTQWSAELLVGVARGLREAGQTADARALIAPLAAGKDLPPELALETALADLRDGPPARALPGLAAASSTPEGAFRYAEGLFFAGAADSAKIWYTRVTANASHPFAGASFERLFLLEDGGSPDVVRAFGRLAYEGWRGNHRPAATLADSLCKTLPRGAPWAEAALLLSASRQSLGDLKGALPPVLTVADSLPEDRLAPLARQRAGDLYMALHDETRALAQYEECLARYPRAWNSAEVRRKVETLRRGRS